MVEIPLVEDERPLHAGPFYSFCLYTFGLIKALTRTHLIHTPQRESGPKDDQDKGSSSCIKPAKDGKSMLRG
jgi:hypothetical protein